MARLSSVVSSLVALASPRASIAFSPGGCGIVHNCGTRTRHSLALTPARPVPSSPRGSHFYATDDDDNPYADPNYPDLEFVNYDDPDYAADRGLGEDADSAAGDADRTLAEIEALREHRRRKNDEFQFETYHATVLRGGERALGEWTVYQTDTFLPGDANAAGGRDPAAPGVPQLLVRDPTLKVVSRGRKVVVDPDAKWRVDGERIVHEERLATPADFPSLTMSGGAWEREDVGHVEHTFWPAEMTALDFRGPGGNMCVGKAYTICDATPLEERNGESHDGPFSEMRTELGVQENGMRFRVKLAYASLDDGARDVGAGAAPPLHLRTLTVCRETLDGHWPDPADNEVPEADVAGTGGAAGVQRRDQEGITAALFGPAGAPGGLYDPPPVGDEGRAVENYMLLDLPGGATVLLPHKLDQGEGDAESGWVTSLDWTPGSIRYQVDRKVLGGSKLKGLRTLELSEVQGAEADRWRPKDGGENMRQ